MIWTIIDPDTSGYKTIRALGVGLLANTLSNPKETP
jgi:hypothetical protein